MKHKLRHQRSTYMYILINHRIATNTTGSHCFKNRLMCTICTCSIGKIIVVLYGRNVCLQHERNHVEISWGYTATGRSMNSVIQTVHTFLMCRFDLSTSEIFVRTGGGHFEHAV